MKITYLGHSCFVIEEKGYSVVIDPYTDGYVPGLADVREEANEVLFSHEHADHKSEGTVKIVEGDERPFKLTKIASFHDDAQGQKRGGNWIHLIESEDMFGKKIRVAHLGDIGCPLNEDQLESLKDLDVLMIPVGGTYTIDAAEAIEMTKQVGARMTIPMHYYSKEGECGIPQLTTVYDYAAWLSNVMLTSVCELDTRYCDNYKNTVMVLQPKNQIKDLSRPRIV